MSSNQYLTFDEELSALRHELGRAIAQWAQVENSVRYICVACFEAGADNMTHRAMQLGFFSIENFRSKLDFADAVVCKVYEGPKAKSWELLLDRTRRASAARNKLVHRSVKFFPLLNKPGRRALLVPWIYKSPAITPRNPRPPDGSLGLLDVIKFRFEFFALHIALENLRERLLGRAALLPESLEQPDHPPKIQTLTPLIRAGHLHLLEPSGQKLALTKIDRSVP